MSCSVLLAAESHKKSANQVGRNPSRIAESPRGAQIDLLPRRVPDRRPPARCYHPQTRASVFGGATWQERAGGDSLASSLWRAASPPARAEAPRSESRSRPFPPAPHPSPTPSRPFSPRRPRGSRGVSRRPTRGTSTGPAPSSTGPSTSSSRTPEGPWPSRAWRRPTAATLDTIHLREIEMLAAGDGFTETRHGARVDRRGGRPAGRRLPRDPGGHGARGGGGRGGEPRPPDRAQRGGALLPRPLPGPPARLVRGRPLARPEAPPAHPRGLRRGGHPPGPRLRRAGRERLQADRLLARQGEGGLAVHQRDRQALRPGRRLVGGRAKRPREGHAGRGALPEGRSTASSGTGTSPWPATTPARARCSGR